VYSLMIFPYGRRYSDLVGIMIQIKFWRKVGGAPSAKSIGTNAGFEILVRFYYRIAGV
jgi:hypothetical protein